MPANSKSDLIQRLKG